LKVSCSKAIRLRMPSLSRAIRQLSCSCFWAGPVGLVFGHGFGLGFWTEDLAGGPHATGAEGVLASNGDGNAAGGLFSFPSRRRQFKSTNSGL
jgi:hypothetical protein